MKIPMYQVDAFTGEIFKGNPPAICILEEWIDDKLMQNIEMWGPWGEGGNIWKV